MEIHFESNKERDIYLKHISKIFPNIILELEVKANISLVFVGKEKIKELNMEYRGKDSATDVLSFNIDDENILGEIYVCIEYIKESTKGDVDLEIVRMIIHGVLHLLGYDHSTHFDESDFEKEEMFVLQENILVKYTNEISSWTR